MNVELFNNRIVYNAGFEAINDYRNGRRVRKKNPQIKLLVSPFILPFVPLEIISEDFGGIIQSCNFVKSRSAAGGSCQITLAGDEQRLRGLSWLPMSQVIADLWNVTGPDLRDIFKPRTLVQVWRDGYHTMTGYVTECKRHAEPGRISYSLSLDELGCILQESILTLDTIQFGSEMNIINDPTSVMSMAAWMTGVDLQNAINLYLNAFLASTLRFGTRGNFRLSDGLSFAFRMIALPPPLGAVAAKSILSNVVAASAMFQTASGQSFWEFLKGLAPDPMMELFTESGGRTICTGRLIPLEPTAGLATVSAAVSAAIPVTNIGISVLFPGFSYVVARSSPYDIPWLGLSPYTPSIYPFLLGVLDLILAGDFIIITDDDVISKDLGQSGAQQYTVFSTNLTGGSAADGSQAMYRPSVARGPLNPLCSGGIRTWGAKHLVSNFPATSMIASGIISQTLEKWYKASQVHALSSLANVYFRNAAKFNEGTITTRSFPYARPGMMLMYMPSMHGGRVDNVRDLGVYYIDNVSDSYTLGKVDQTTFSVIRGVPIPFQASAFARLLFDFEFLPPGMSLFDGEF